MASIKNYIFIIIKVGLLILFLTLSTLTGYSSNVKFYELNSVLGINMREVTSICKDENGFIWASSKIGILRLTEDNYHIYQLPYQTADVLFVKLVYDKDTLLAYTNNGQIFVYNTLLDRFDLVIDIRTPLDDKFLSLTKILIEKEDVFFISSSAGLCKYEEGTLSRLENYTGEINYIQWYDDQSFFVVGDGKIALMNSSTTKSQILYKFSESTLVFTSLHYEERANKLWLGTTSDGLFCYDLVKEEFVQLIITGFPKQPIQAFAENSDSTLLVGIDGQGIWELTKDDHRVLNIYKEDLDNPLSLKGNGVYDIYNEDNKRIWVCTYSGGLSFFDKEKNNVVQVSHNINNPNSLNNNDVNKIIEDRKGNLWFATNNGVSCWNVKTNEWKTYFDNKSDNAQAFLSLCEDRQGNIWAGTYSSGVHVIDGKTGKESVYYSKESENSGLTNNFIFDIFEDSAGDLWMGGPMGNIFCYNVYKNKFKEYPFLPVYVFAELSPNKILLGCTLGLCLLNKETETFEIILEGYIIHDILVIGDEVWLGTSGDGLLSFNIQTKSVKKYTTKAGLTSNHVNSLFLEHGSLWLGTENGLCSFSLEDKSIQEYTSMSLHLNVSFNQNSKAKLKTNQLIWGTNHGAVMFDPSSLQYSKPEGRIYFQDLIISGRSIRENPVFSLDKPLDCLDKISLDYSQNTLTLEFLPIGTPASNAKFSWKMEGVDSDWAEPTSYRNLTYANMSSGNHVLKVRMFDSSLSEMISERMLLIEIAPPFWNAWWFRLMLMFILLYVVYISLRFYINRLKQQYTEDKIRFFTNTAHDIRTSLTLIKAPVEELNAEENLSEKGKYFLRLATEQVRRLSSVTTQLLDFQKVDIGKGQMSLNMVNIVDFISHRKLMFESLAKSKNINLILTSDQVAFHVAVDEIMMTKIVDNLISNAIKYSHPNSQVEITISTDDFNWTLEVRDFGMGISKKEQGKLFQEFYRSENAINSKIVGSGIGLLLVKHYVALHDGIIAFESKENEGSRFQITIPVKVVEKGETVSLSEKEVLLPESVDIQLDITLEDDAIPKNMHILIVEDNDDLRTFIKHSLSGKLNISMAQDGVEAWEHIQKTMPDLVVSDIMMPNMDGYELCRVIKSTFETSHIPVILLTALTEREEQLRGLSLGAEDYITKPFDMHLLYQKIKTIIENRNAVRDRVLKTITKGNEEQVFANELNDQFVKKAIEVVHANIDNPKFGKDHFANEMHVSSSLLYKKIKALTDQSPVDFIKSIRLNYALELLQVGKYNVTEISILCGFSSVGYFSTAFKKHFDKSPTEI